MAWAFFDRAAIEQIGGDAGGAEGMAVGRHTQFGLAHAPLDHAEDIDAVHAVRGEGAALGHRAPQRGALLVSDPGRLEVGVEILLGVVVGGEAPRSASLRRPGGPEGQGRVALSERRKQANITYKLTRNSQGSQK